MTADVAAAPTILGATRVERQRRAALLAARVPSAERGPSAAQVPEAAWASEAEAERVPEAARVPAIELEARQEPSVAFHTDT